MIDWWLVMVDWWLTMQLWLWCNFSLLGFFQSNFQFTLVFCGLSTVVLSIQLSRIVVIGSWLTTVADQLSPGPEMADGAEFDPASLGFKLSLSRFSNLRIYMYLVDFLVKL